jgi:hypothetical protein
MSDITKKEVDIFNKVYFPFKGFKIVKTEVKRCWKIEIDHPYFESATLNPSELFYKQLEEHFGKLNYNNTGTTFWRDFE